MPGYDDDLRLAHVLADGADAVTMSRFKALDLRVDTKPDLTPVTDADRAVEEAIRGTLRRSRPRDAITGEEFGETGHGPRRWVLDPIDGTKNFVRGVPVWATLIALMDGDVVVAGVVSAPGLGRRWWAAHGTGAYTGKSLASATRLAVSEIGDLRDASLSYSSLGGWLDSGRGRGFLDLYRGVWRQRGVRGLLVLHARRRGRRRHRRRTRGGPVRPGRARRGGRGGRRALHGPGGASGTGRRERGGDQRAAA